jgi:hypothetical protein
MKKSIKDVRRIKNIKFYPCIVCGANPHKGYHFISNVGRIFGHYNSGHINPIPERVYVEKIIIEKD